MAHFKSDRWEIVENLPETGQSWTHKVKERTPEKSDIYILKRLKNPARLARFEKEIQALTYLEHSGIVHLIDFELDDERPWFVQEYCAGGDLDTYVKLRGMLDPVVALDFFIQMTEALEYAHSKGVFHHDIKPANIFLRSENGPVVLGDFGLCWIDDNKQRLTLTQEAVGSFRFMAPELSDGRIEDPTWNSDIYSLGKVLYFMLSGGRVFDREVHKSPQWDIVKIRGDFRMQFINELLDKMIVIDEDDRLPARDLHRKAELVRRLIASGYAPLVPDAEVTCQYCGIGIYKPVVNSDEQFRTFFGLQSTAVGGGQRNWRVLSCDHCGNLQWFRIQPNNRWWPEQR